LPQPIVQLDLPDVLQRPSSTAEHQHQRQYILLRLEAMAGAWWWQTLPDAAADAQRERRLLKQCQPGAAGDGVSGLFKLEIEPFLRYSTSNHKAAPLFTQRVKAVHTC
jgi:hypothetical protein